MITKKRAFASAADNPNSMRNNLFSGLQTLVFALLFLLLVFTFLGRICMVIGPSMEPTLEDGQVLLLQHAGYTPAQGDIVVLTHEFSDVTEPYVKRVIAVGGQTVDIDYARNCVYVDGEALDEPYLKEAMIRLGPPREQTHYLVPEGHIFVLGDNRNISNDSRHEELGPVDSRYILGKACFVLLPLGSIGAV